MTLSGISPRVRAAILVALTVLVYVPALRAGFIWDDVQTYILENPLIQRRDGLWHIWTSGQPMDYYPLTFTTWWLEWRLWGPHAAGYHALNVLLHAASALLVWRLMLRLRVPGAWLVALVYALHPVNVQSVAWISQRKNTLSALFFFATLVCWLRFEVTTARRERRAWYVRSLVLFVLALLSKSSTVILPAMLLLLAWWQRHRIERRDVVRTLPFWIVALGLGLVTVYFQGRLIDKAAVAVRDASAGQRVLDAGWAVWFYLSKAVVPLRLTLVYPYRAAPSVLVGAASCAALAAAFAAAWWFRHRWGRPLLAALAWFVIALLPVVGFIDIGFMQYALVSDHWQYIAIVAPIALGIGLAAFLLRARGVAPQRAAVPAVLVVAACASLSWRQCGIYKNEETAWRDTLRKNPTAAVANNNLGKILLATNRVDEAVPYLAEAVRQDPRSLMAYVNLATARARQGRLPEATALFESAIALEPRYSPAHFNLGLLLMQQGKIEQAAGRFETAVRLEPRNAAAHQGLGNALVRLQRLDAAAREFEAFIALRPSSPDGYYNLGMLRLAQGDVDGAARQLESAARLGDAAARRKLDEILAQRRGGGR